MIFSLAKEQNIITTEAVIAANTLLTHTEYLMPKALGEFGKAKNSAESHKIMTILENANAPVPLQTLWKHTYQDFNNRNQLVEVLNNLQVAGKINNLSTGFLPIKSVKKEPLSEAVDWSLLTPEERAI
jgi:hypothetical protein